MNNVMRVIVTREFNLMQNVLSVTNAKHETSVLVTIARGQHSLGIRCKRNVLWHISVLHHQRVTCCVETYVVSSSGEHCAINDKLKRHFRCRLLVTHLLSKCGSRNSQAQGCEQKPTLFHSFPLSSASSVLHYEYEAVIQPLSATRRWGYFQRQPPIGGKGYVQLKAR